MTLNPILRLTLGLVGLMACLLISADLLFGLVPDASSTLREQRSRVASNLTRQLVDRMVTGDHRAVEQALDRWRAGDDTLQSVTIRDAAGRLIARSGVQTARADEARAESVGVLVESNGAKWGEAIFQYERPTLAQTGLLGGDRLWVLAALPLVAGLLAYGYLRRALHYLDPEGVVPDRLRSAFDGLGEGVALVDGQGRLILANRSLREVLGFGDQAKLHGRRFADVFAFEWPADVAEPAWQMVLRSGEAVLGTQGTLLAGGRRVIGRVNCSPVTDAAGKVRGCLVTFADLTAIEQRNAELRVALAELERSRQKIEEQNRDLAKLANMDGLTGLLNRRCYFESAEAALDRCTQKRESCAVFMLDVDHFKSFNDRYGHAVGDAVLQRVASCLRNALRPNDLAGRYGGEEFSAMAENISAEDAYAMAERIRRRIEAEAGIGADNGRDLQVTVSVGVCVSPAGAIALPTMLQRADECLYAAKRSGRNRVVTSGETALAVSAE